MTRCPCSIPDGGPYRARASKAPDGGRGDFWPPGFLAPHPVPILPPPGAPDAVCSDMPRMNPDTAPDDNGIEGSGLEL